MDLNLAVFEVKPAEEQYEDEPDQLASEPTSGGVSHGVIFEIFLLRFMAFVFGARPLAEALGLAPKTNRTFCIIMM